MAASAQVSPPVRRSDSLWWALPADFTIAFLLDDQKTATDLHSFVIPVTVCSSLDQLTALCKFDRRIWQQPGGFYSIIPRTPQDTTGPRTFDVYFNSSQPRRVLEQVALTQLSDEDFAGVITGTPQNTLPSGSLFYGIHRSHGVTLWVRLTTLQRLSARVIQDWGRLATQDVSDGPGSSVSLRNVRQVLARAYPYAVFQDPAQTQSPWLGYMPLDNNSSKSLVVRIDYRTNSPTSEPTSLEPVFVFAIDEDVSSCALQEAAATKDLSCYPSVVLSAAELLGALEGGQADPHESKQEFTAVDQSSCEALSNLLETALLTGDKPLPRTKAHDVLETVYIAFIELKSLHSLPASSRVLGLTNVLGAAGQLMVLLGSLDPLSKSSWVNSLKQLFSELSRLISDFLSRYALSVATETSEVDVTQSTIFETITVEGATHAEASADALFYLVVHASAVLLIALYDFTDCGSPVDLLLREDLNLSLQQRTKRIEILSGLLSASFSSPSKSSARLRSALVTVICQALWRSSGTQEAEWQHNPFADIIYERLMGRSKRFVHACALRGEDLCRQVSSALDQLHLATTGPQETQQKKPSQTSPSSAVGDKHVPLTLSLRSRPGRAIGRLAAHRSGQLLAMHWMLTAAHRRPSVSVKDLEGQEGLTWTMPDVPSLQATASPPLAYELEAITQLYAVVVSAKGSVLNSQQFAKQFHQLIAMLAKFHHESFDALVRAVMRRPHILSSCIIGYLDCWLGQRQSDAEATDCTGLENLASDLHELKLVCSKLLASYDEVQLLDESVLDSTRDRRLTVGITLGKALASLVTTSPSSLSYDSVIQAKRSICQTIFHLFPIRPELSTHISNVQECIALWRVLTFTSSHPDTLSRARQAFSSGAEESASVSDSLHPGVRLVSLGRQTPLLPMDDYRTPDHTVSCNCNTSTIVDELVAAARESLNTSYAKTDTHFQPDSASLRLVRMAGQALLTIEAYLKNALQLSSLPGDRPTPPDLMETPHLLDALGINSPPVSSHSTLTHSAQPQNEKLHPIIRQCLEALPPLAILWRKLLGLLSSSTPTTGVCKERFPRSLEGIDLVHYLVEQLALRPGLTEDQMLAQLSARYSDTTTFGISVGHDNFMRGTPERPHSTNDSCQPAPPINDFTSPAIYRVQIHSEVTSLAFDAWLSNSTSSQPDPNVVQDTLQALHHQRARLDAAIEDTALYLASTHRDCAYADCSCKRLATLSLAQNSNSDGCRVPAVAFVLDFIRLCAQSQTAPLLTLPVQTLAQLTQALVLLSLSIHSLQSRLVSALEHARHRLSHAVLSPILRASMDTIFWLLESATTTLRDRAYLHFARPEEARRMDLVAKACGESMTNFSSWIWTHLRVSPTSAIECMHSMLAPMATATCGATVIVTALHEESALIRAVFHELHYEALSISRPGVSSPNPRRRGTQISPALRSPSTAPSSTPHDGVPQPCSDHSTVSDPSITPVQSESSQEKFEPKSQSSNVTATVITCDFATPALNSPRSKDRDTSGERARNLGDIVQRLDFRSPSPVKRSHRSTRGEKRPTTDRKVRMLNRLGLSHLIPAKADQTNSTDNGESTSVSESSHESDLRRAPDSNDIQIMMARADSKPTLGPQEAHNSRTSEVQRALSSLGLGSLSDLATNASESASYPLPNPQESLPAFIRRLNTQQKHSLLDRAIALAKERGISLQNDPEGVPTNPVTPAPPNNSNSEATRLVRSLTKRGRRLHSSLQALIASATEQSSEWTSASQSQDTNEMTKYTDLTTHSLIRKLWTLMRTASNSSADQDGSKSPRNQNNIHAIDNLERKSTSLDPLRTTTSPPGNGDTVSEATTVTTVRGTKSNPRSATSKGHSTAPASRRKKVPGKSAVRSVSSRRKGDSKHTEAVTKEAHASDEEDWLRDGWGSDDGSLPSARPRPNIGLDLAKVYAASAGYECDSVEVGYASDWLDMQSEHHVQFEVDEVIDQDKAAQDQSNEHSVKYNQVTERFRHLSPTAENTWVNPEENDPRSASSPTVDAERIAQDFAARWVAARLEENRYNADSTNQITAIDLESRIHGLPLALQQDENISARSRLSEAEQFEESMLEGMVQIIRAVGLTLPSAPSESPELSSPGRNLPTVSHKCRQHDPPLPPPKAPPRPPSPAVPSRASPQAFRTASVAHSVHLKSPVFTHRPSPTVNARPTPTYPRGLVNPKALLAPSRTARTSVVAMQGSHASQSEMLQPLPDLFPHIVKHYLEQLSRRKITLDTLLDTINGVLPDLPGTCPEIELNVKAAISESLPSFKMDTSPFRRCTNLWIRCLQICLRTLLSLSGTTIAAHHSTRLPKSVQTARVEALHAIRKSLADEILLLRDVLRTFYERSRSLHSLPDSSAAGDSPNHKVGVVWSLSRLGARARELVLASSLAVEPDSVIMNVPPSTQEDINAVATLTAWASPTYVSKMSTSSKQIDSSDIDSDEEDASLGTLIAARERVEARLRVCEQLLHRTIGEVIGLRLRTSLCVDALHSLRMHLSDSKRVETAVAFEEVQSILSNPNPVVRAIARQELGLRVSKRDTPALRLLQLLSVSDTIPGLRPLGAVSPDHARPASEGKRCLGHGRYGSVYSVPQSLCADPDGTGPQAIKCISCSASPLEESALSSVFSEVSVMSTLEAARVPDVCRMFAYGLVSASTIANYLTPPTNEVGALVSPWSHRSSSPSLSQLFTPSSGRPSSSTLSRSRGASLVLLTEAYETSLASWRTQRPPLVTYSRQNKRGSPCKACGAIDPEPRFRYSDLMLYLVLFRRIVVACELMRRAGVYHMDLKCGNVLLSIPTKSDAMASQPQEVNPQIMRAMLIRAFSEVAAYKVALCDFGESICDSFTDSPYASRIHQLQPEPSANSSTLQPVREAVRSRRLRTSSIRGTENMQSPEILSLHAAKSWSMSSSTSALGATASSDTMGLSNGSGLQRRRESGIGIDCEKCDVWALGCLLFELLTSELLFQNSIEIPLIVAISSNSLPTVSAERCARLGHHPGLLKLLNSILVRDATRRPTLQRLLELVDNTLVDLVTSRGV